MNGISHKQAIKLIEHRLDGLLSEKQTSLLEEHLHSCDSCRLYSTEMDQLPARLQNKFNLRWDENPGPSQKILEQITREARSIPMTNRLSAGIKLFSGIATLAVLAFLVNFVISQMKRTPTEVAEPGPAGGLPLAEVRILAFTSTAENGTLDIYTMRSNGNELINLTKEPANDFNPFWSPDGRRIAFESDRYGSVQLFLMDADGSNVTQLTHGETEHEFNVANPWSPDGNRLLYTERISGEEKWVLYVMDIDGQNKIQLVQTPSRYGGPSWSPDSKHIAFDLVEPGKNRDKDQIYIVDKDGSNLTNVTRLLPQDEDVMFWNFPWASDGKSIFFVAGRYAWENNARYAVYEASLDGNTLTEIFTTSDRLDDWWDGTAFIQGFDGSPSLTWVRSDGTASTLQPFENCQTREAMGSTSKRSANGSLLYGAQCDGGDLRLYWANPDGTVIQQLLDSPMSAKGGSLVDISWSPDDTIVAFTIAFPDRTEMYILNVNAALNNPATQPEKIVVGGAGFISYNMSWQP